MELEMLNASVVVLSDGNNPKLLNHDFLARNKIVPEEWNVQDIVITPPFSNIIYKNGVQFIVELNKLQILAAKPEQIDCDRDLPKMVTDYLKVLPHVSYLGVGVNFVFVLKNIDHDYLQSSLLIDGPWLHQEGDVSRTAIEFNYLNVHPQFNLKIEPLIKDGLDQDKHSSDIKFSVNFHQAFNPDQESLRVKYILEMKKMKTRFMEYAEHLPFVCEQEK